MPNPTYIESKSRRHVSLCKRKSSLVRKLHKFSQSNNTQVAFLSVSEAGNGTTYFSPGLKDLSNCPQFLSLIQHCLAADDVKIEAESQGT
ncbi:hypothetical protein RCL1_003820 [Eukaryota sp. TZLM3-RCL]